MKPKNPEMDFSKRATVFAPLKQFCYMSRDEDYIEVTQWTNLEGFDINISDISGNKFFSMTDGEFEALKKLVKFLDKETNKE